MDDDDDTQRKPFRLHPDWRGAMALWRETGRTGAIEHLVTTGEPIPEDLRQQFADFVAGRLKRKRGAPSQLTVAKVAKAALVRLAYERHRSAPMTHEAAIFEVMDEFGLTADQAGHAVFPRERQGA
jgi:hypothetical protein